MIRAVTETASKLSRLRELVAARGLPGIVLTRPATVAWLTGGMTNVIDRSAGQDAVWIAVGPDDGACITTTVEGPRLRAEMALPFERRRGAVAGGRRLPPRGGSRWSAPTRPTTTRSTRS